MAGCEILDSQKRKCRRGYAHDEPCDFGESAITRDMLLSEIRRSLMATHPDRAEALCAALERRIPLEEPSEGDPHPGWLYRTVENGRTVYSFRGGGATFEIETAAPMALEDTQT